MSGEMFKIRIISSKNCFLHIPEKWIRMINETRNLKDAAIVRMLYGHDSVAYLTCAPTPLKDSNQNSAGLNATLAQCLHISDGDDIIISLEDYVPSLSSVHITPVSSDDFEILVESSGAVESLLLDQVRVVWTGQVLPIWLSKTFCLKVHVDALKPQTNVGRLEQFTELVVNSPRSSDVFSKSTTQNNSTTKMAPGTKETVNTRASSTEQLLSNLPRPAQLNLTHSSSEHILKKWLSSGKKILNSALNGSDKEETSDSGRNHFQNLMETSKGIPQSFRVYPLHYENADAQFPCHVFVHNKVFTELTKNYFTSSVICKINKLVPPKISLREKSEDGNKHQLEENTTQLDQSHSAESIHDLCAFLFAVETVEDVRITKIASSQTDCVYITDNMRRMLGLQIGARAQLSISQENMMIKNIRSIEITPLVKNSKDIEYAVNIGFKNLVTQSKYGLIVSSHSKYILPQPASLKDSQETVVSISFTPAQHGYFILGKEQFENCKIDINSGNNADFSVRSLQYLDSHLTTDPNHFTGSVKNFLSAALHSVKLTLGLYAGRGSVEDNVLVVGKTGSGKTSFVKMLCRQLQDTPDYVWIKKIDCKPLKGRKAEGVIRILKEAFAAAVYHQPSILVLDDVDSIAGLETDNEHIAAHDLSVKRVARVIRETAESLQSKHCIAIAATAVSASSVNRELVSARGNHLFKLVVEIPDLTRSDRQEVLNKALSSREGVATSDGLDLDYFASKTEGYTCQDLSDFVDKAVFVAWKKKGSSSGADNSECVVDKDVLMEALSMSTPMSLRGVQLHQETSTSWEDVGGLTVVKEELLEILKWPSMYPALFEQCPLRLQSGVLLYGAPGTGKTLLAGAVAHECGIHFISIKGPELLSKYIGASEESVRKVFEKAASAKPCILFFDEFDSLAPRRGHDSTGVTDRVVNQLLTQLDGVESLNGVWVLAATSRPDLIDPALLRPGRLDRIIHCPLPDENDRLSILRSLSRHLNLAADVQLELLAKRTNGFTGADLQAVLYNSQLAALQTREKDLAARPGGAAGASKVKSNEDQTPSSLLEVFDCHIQEALAGTRPSLPPSEFEKYRRIYELFASSRGIPTAAMFQKKQKATLA